MFRYGGPIKQGIMSGIREPKKNGGLSKQFGTGLVGDERYPKTDGREHHLAIIPPILAGLGVAGRFLARPFGSWAMKQIPKLSRVKYRHSSMGSGPGGWEKIASKNMPKMDAGWQFTPNKVGKYLLGSPEGRLLTGGAGWAGAAGKKALGAAKWVGKSPLTVGSLVYMGGKWLWPDGTPANENEIKSNFAKTKRTVGTSGAPGGGDPGMYLTPQGEAPPPGKSEAQLKKEQIQKYRDIMDIKGMNKEAAANSLIEASRLINESGDFKGDIKSGSLINKIIGATSKAFDKPADTKRAIDTLILKGEIEKDINQSKGTAAFQAIDALAQASGKSHKYVANQKLGVPNTIGEAITQLKTTKKLPTSDDVATRVYSFSEQSGVPVQKHITTEQKNEIIGKDKKYASLTELISKEEFTEDGYYIIGTSVIEVIDGVPRIKA